MIKRVLLKILTDILPGALLFFCAYTFYTKSLHASPLVRISEILLGSKLALNAGIFIFRRWPSSVTRDPWNILISLTATFMPALFSTTSKESWPALGLAIQILGLILSILAFISLGRSFAVIAANRGIQTRGLYKFVRHPLYLSYLVGTIGFVICVPSFYNIILAYIWFGLAVLRIYSEERFLEKDPAYAAYQKEVPCRLIPFVF
jgi:protein-S-isoprenylcysteine O-methyltransferase Ste14